MGGIETDHMSEDEFARRFAGPGELEGDEDGGVLSCCNGVGCAGCDPDDEGYPGPCTDPGGHVWPRVEEHERCLCVHCGADGDA